MEASMEWLDLFYGWDGDLFVCSFVSYFEGMEKFFAVLYISKFPSLLL
jgi:hypothetical protein